MYQRYYIEAKIRGPCWSSQIDEVATVVWGIGRHFHLTGNRGFIESMWPMIEKAADFMCENMDPSTNLLRSVGLWEEKFGSHTYSNAAVYRALKTAASTAEIMRQNALRRQWGDIAEKIRLALMKLAWDSQNAHFIKTVEPKDSSLDVSLLGLAFPFEVLPADDRRMRKTALAIEQAFSYRVGGIGRYREDTYYGGNPWVLATLWLALYYEQLKELDKPKQLINWAIHRATGLNLLSEQIDKLSDTPISAIPLAWSHAFLILAVLGLDELQRSEQI